MLLTCCLPMKHFLPSPYSRLTTSHSSAFSLSVPSSGKPRLPYYGTYPAFMGVLLFQSLSFLLHEGRVGFCCVHRAYHGAWHGFVEQTNSLSRANKATCPLQCSLCLTVLPPPTTTLSFPLAKGSCLMSSFHSVHVGHETGPLPVWNGAPSSPR